MSMTENLLQKLEERTMSLITEVEDLRKENQQLRSESHQLKTERDKFLQERSNQEAKIKELIALLDAVSNLDMPSATQTMSTVKPMLVQG